MFIVYALYSPSHQKIYIGFTSGLEQRLLSLILHHTAFPCIRALTHLLENPILTLVNLNAIEAL